MNGLTMALNTSVADLCNSCQKKPCCVDFDAPIVFPSDFEKLIKIGKSGPEFIEDTNIGAVKIKQILKKEGSTSCIFFDEKNIRCKIYHNRPFDCEMFPFDIVWDDGAYHWMVYSCNPDSDWKWCEEHLQKFESDPRFEEVMQKAELYIHTTFAYLEKGLKTPKVILRKVNWKRNKVNSQIA